MVANRYLANVVLAPRVNLQGAVLSGIIEYDP